MNLWFNRLSYITHKERTSRSFRGDRFSLIVYRNDVYSTSKSNSSKIERNLSASSYHQQAHYTQHTTRFQPQCSHHCFRNIQDLAALLGKPLFNILGCECGKTLESIKKRHVQFTGTKETCLWIKILLQQLLCLFINRLGQVFPF